MLDLSINDFASSERFSHPERHAMERIMRECARGGCGEGEGAPHSMASSPGLCASAACARRVLALRPQPALVFFEAYSWFQAAGTFVGFGKYGA